MTTRQLKSAAAAALPADHKPIIRIYTAVYLALSLALFLVALGAEYLLSLTDGLGDFQKRTAIQAADLLITTAIQVFVPLWTMGLTACALGFARRQAVTPHNLLDGARRWGGFLRYGLCLVAVYIVAAYGVMMLAIPTVLFSTMGQTMMETMEPLMESDTITSAMIPRLLEVMLPLYVVILVLILAVIIAMRYLLGIGHYRLLDQDRPRALAAMADSLKLLTGHRWALFKLDLSYWWFFLLTAVINGIMSVPDILLLAGVELPIGETGLYVLSYGVGFALLWLLYTKALPKRETAYALFYDSLLPKEELTIDNG